MTDISIIRWNGEDLAAPCGEALVKDAAEHLGMAVAIYVEFESRVVRRIPLTVEKLCVAIGRPRVPDHILLRRFIKRHDVRTDVVAAFLDVSDAVVRQLVNKGPVTLSDVKERLQIGSKMTLLEDERARLEGFGDALTAWLKVRGNMSKVMPDDSGHTPSATYNPQPVPPLEQVAKPVPEWAEKKTCGY